MNYCLGLTLDESIQWSMQIGKCASQVLGAMVAAGYIDEKTAQAARAKPATLRMSQTAARGARYFAQWILEEVTAYVGHVGRDITVVTTLDKRLQGAAERAVAQALNGPGAKLQAGQAALVALSPDGAVRAMVGGRDYRQSQFNRVTQARRQPGSAFKPFVYLAALEAGFGPNASQRQTARATSSSRTRARSAAGSVSSTPRSRYTRSAPGASSSCRQRASSQSCHPCGTSFRPSATP